MAALVMVLAVVVGFCLRPRKETFYLRTTLIVSEPDYPLAVEHDRIAVRIELARLWLLFLPTFAAVAFLIVTSANGTMWKFSLLNRFWETSSYPIWLGIRAFQVIVVGLLATWISERWVLRDAEACSADSVSITAGCFLYSFRDRAGEYYGGEGFPFALVRSPKLARIVFYRVSNPQANKIAAGCLFHRPVIVGRVITDLDEATLAIHSGNVQPASQPIRQGSLELGKVDSHEYLRNRPWEKLSLNCGRPGMVTATLKPLCEGAGSWEFESVGQWPFT
jgi:hypothetical protein